MAISTTIAKQQEYDYYLRKKMEEEYYNQQKLMYDTLKKETYISQHPFTSSQEQQIVNKESDILLLLEDLA